MPHEYGHTGNGNGSSSSRVGRNTTNAQGRVNSFIFFKHNIIS